MRQIGALRSCVKERFAVPASCLGVGFISTWTELNYINSPVVYAANHDALFALFDAGTIVLAIVMAVVVRFVGGGSYDRFEQSTPCTDVLLPHGVNVRELRLDASWLAEFVVAVGFCHSWRCGRGASLRDVV